MKQLSLFPFLVEHSFIDRVSKQRVEALQKKLIIPILAVLVFTLLHSIDNAYAYSANNQTNSTITNSTITNSTITNSTITSLPVTNSTITNSTITSLPVTNSTIIFGYSNSTTTSLPVTNSTTTSLPVTNSTTTSLPVTNSTTTNSTTTSLPVTNSTTTNSTITNSTTGSTAIPSLQQAWQFSSLISHAKIVGNVEFNVTTQVSVKLNGQGYIEKNIISARNLAAFTLSAWVKPDYSQGSSQFTVISKQNSFVLAVNNNLPPAKKAIFSIFDGIKWDTVSFNSTIPEEWTHLVATFNGTSISIYVNGEQESTILPTVPTISVDGKLTARTVNNLSSDADIVIGGYFDTVRDLVRNQFSGEIKDVNLYDSLLTPTQIAQLR